MSETRLLNYVAGEWRRSGAAEYVPVRNPATAQAIAEAPLSPREDVAAAVAAAAEAFPDWRRTPATDRVQHLFRFKALLETNLDELAASITEECGKTRAESLGELRRGIENVETACGVPALMQGYNSEDVARGIDEHMFRQPLGVVAAITPFNFPAMIPLWFLPYALACGDCFILKPSEKTPVTARRLFELLDRLDLPPGVVQLVHGGRGTAEALLEHPDVRAISFVGSSPVARHVYRRAAEHGKRVQCQGGAKNPVVLMPDAEPEMTTRILADAAFGCAGQRCLALAEAVVVGEAAEVFVPRIAEAAATRRVGYGLDAGVEMGAVISAESKARIEGLIEQSRRDSAEILVDGRGRKVSGYEDGFFVFPTVLDHVPPSSEAARSEIFGPVLHLARARTLDEALALVNGRGYGNMACIFTSDGATARAFRYAADAGNIGVNVGVAAPMAFFPFSGWNDSFFGDLHAQGRHAVEFYTQTKVVVERWPGDWSRKF